MDWEPRYVLLSPYVESRFTNHFPGAGSTEQRVRAGVRAQGRPSPTFEAPFSKSRPVSSFLVPMDRWLDYVQEPAWKAQG